jgi:succinoglycan biosynthesis protein ExoM
MSRVAIGIPTFRRPDGLEALLYSLAGLNTRHEVSIFVADNDVNLQEGWHCAQYVLSKGYRWPISAFVVEERGISQVRNSLIDACRSDPEFEFIGMLDDDEVADAGWLDEMLRIQAKTGADIVGGRLDRQLEREPPNWVKAVPYLSSKTHGCSGSVDLVDSSGNILFSSACIEAAQRPLFDVAFGMTGGEDKEALTRLHRAGARFAWADNAIVTETIPASRITEGWVMQRAFRIGNSDMRVLLRHGTSAFGVVTEIIKAIVVLFCMPCILLVSFANPQRRIKTKMMIWRAAGKIASLAGFAYREYAVTQR